MKTIILKYLILIALLGIVTALSEAQAQSLRLSMEDAVTLSLEKNKILKISKLEAEKSLQRVKEAKGAVLPTINAAGQYLYFTQKQVSFLPGSFVGLDDSQLTAIRVGGENSIFGGLTISQPVYRPDIHSRIRSEKIYNAMGQEALDDTRAEVITGVKKAYLNVLITVEQLKIQQQSVERNELALKDARSLLAQGRASRVDTLRAYVNVQNLRPEIIRLTNAVEIGKTHLKRAIGLDEDLTIELTDSLYIGEKALVLELEDAAEEALENRPEIRRLKLNRQYNKELVALQSSARLPGVSAIGALQVQSEANNFNINDYAWPVSSFLGLQLNIPVFSGMRNIYKTKQAQISLFQTEKELENLVDLVRAEVKVGLSKVEEASLRIEVQEQTVATAELSYQITRDRWKQGIASRLDLSDAELSLTQSKSVYLQAVYDYLVASVELNRILGSVRR